jgi:hypothetical protein
MPELTTITDIIAHQPIALESCGIDLFVLGHKVIWI